jgi:hypothetical protein
LVSAGSAAAIASPASRADLAVAAIVAIEAYDVNVCRYVYYYVDIYSYFMINSALLRLIGLR